MVFRRGLNDPDNHDGVVNHLEPDILECERERYILLKPKFQRIARRDKKAFLSEQSKMIEESNRMGKTRDLFKKMKIPRGNLMPT